MNPLRAFLLLAVSATVAAQTPPPAKTPYTTEEERLFGAAVLKAVYRIQPLSKDFKLTISDRAAPVVPAVEEDKWVNLACENVVDFGFAGAEADNLGGLIAATCKDGAQVRELAPRAKARAAAELKEMSVPEGKARKMGWYSAHEKLKDGADFYYFPVIVTGHGVGFFLTGALVDKSGSAIVVQTAATFLCEDVKDSPFCKDARKALLQLAQALREARK